MGRTRTLPVETDHVVFAMVSCAKLNAGFFNAYARLAERDDLQFLLHLGDYIYEASNTPPASQTPGADIGRPFDPLHECVTLDDYRTRYNQYHRDPEVQLLHRRARDRSRRSTTTSSPTAPGATAPPSTSRSTGLGRSAGRMRSRREKSGCRSGVPTRTIPSACGAR